MCYGDQNHRQQTIYLNVSNFLMIYNENLPLSGWYLAPVLAGLRSDVTSRWLKSFILIISGTAMIDCSIEILISIKFWKGAKFRCFFILVILQEVKEIEYVLISVDCSQYFD